MRICVVTKEQDGKIIAERCGHLFPNGKKTACGMLRKGIILSTRRLKAEESQTYCPITAGYGFSAKFNSNLDKHKE